MTIKMDNRKGRASYEYGGMNIKSLFRRHGVACCSASEETLGRMKLSAFKDLKEGIVAQA